MSVQLVRFGRIVRRLRRNRAGVTSVELGIVASLLALAALQALGALGGQVESDVNAAAAVVAEKRSERADPFARRGQGNDVTNTPGQEAGTENPVEPPVAATQVYTTDPAQPPPTVMSPPVPN